MTQVVCRKRKNLGSVEVERGVTAASYHNVLLYIT